MMSDDINNATSRRIEWIDVFKALAIIFVVLGHATGKYNIYIYQFHISAFFFISGVTARFEDKKLGQIVVEKFFVLLLPLIVMIIIGSFVEKILYFYNYYELLSTYPYLDIIDKISTFLKTGDLYIQFLGATWFIPVLYGIYIIQKRISIIFDSDWVGYLVSSTIIYLLGYYLISNGIRIQIGMFPVDLIFVGQFFFCLGKTFKIGYKHISVNSSTLAYFVTILFNLLVFYYFGNKVGLTVDYASRYLSNSMLNALEAINGICFCYCLSKLIVKLPTIIKNTIICIGRNSMAILLFHFVFFKMINLFFYLNGKISVDDLKSVVPNTEIGNKYYLLFVIVSIAGSIGIWKIIEKVPVTNYLFGMSNKKYKETASRICDLN